MNTLESKTNPVSPEQLAADAMINEGGAVVQPPPHRHVHSLGLSEVLLISFGLGLIFGWRFTRG